MDMDKKKVMLLATILIAGTTIAVGAQLGVFHFIDNFTGLIESDRRIPASFTLTNLPEYFAASVDVEGSGYTGQPHTVDISISHSRPDTSIWLAAGNYSLDLELSAVVEETITSGSFIDLRNTEPFSAIYSWTPISPADTYDLVLSLKNIVWSILTEYTITATADTGGSISPSGPVMVPKGESPTFNATAASGYTFDSFLIDTVPIFSLGTYTFPDVQEDHTIHAIFSQIEYTITASASTGGTIDPVGATTVFWGDSPRFNITPDAGYRIANVLVDGSSVGSVSSYLFVNVQGDYTIVASFEAIGHIITATAGTEGIIEPSGATTVLRGDSQGFTITPNAGYEIADVLVDGSSVGTVSSYTFDNVQVDHTISAVFANGYIYSLSRIFSTTNTELTFTAATFDGYDPNTYSAGDTVNFIITVAWAPEPFIDLTELHYDLHVDLVGGPGINQINNAQLTVTPEITTPGGTFQITGSFIQPTGQLGDWQIEIVARPIYSATYDKSRVNFFGVGFVYQSTLFNSEATKLYHTGDTVNFDITLTYISDSVNLNSVNYIISARPIDGSWIEVITDGVEIFSPAIQLDKPLHITGSFIQPPGTTGNWELYLTIQSTT